MDGSRPLKPAPHGICRSGAASAAVAGRGGNVRHGSGDCGRPRVRPVMHPYGRREHVVEPAERFRRVPAGRRRRGGPGHR
ncbi:unnamed protein product [[Actinomadura] parvosata subsp. kistnae]|nr:unnamed protein product [Actinomadura parvosata subsp. kistnae]